MKIAGWSQYDVTMTDLVLTVLHGVPIASHSIEAGPYFVTGEAAGVYTDQATHSLSQPQQHSTTHACLQPPLPPLHLIINSN